MLLPYLFILFHFHLSPPPRAVQRGTLIQSARLDEAKHQKTRTRNAKAKWLIMCASAMLKNRPAAGIIHFAYTRADCPRLCVRAAFLHSVELQ